MAKYNKTKKYWLQLKEDWFEEDSIKWLEEQKNGKEYSLFYMKLMCKAIKTEGILIRQVGKVLIPYEPSTLAELTRTDIDTVMVAMGLLKKIGLIEILEDGAIFINAVQNMIGSTTISALKKQEQLKNKDKKEIGWTSSGIISTKDKVKDKDITIVKEYKEKTTRFLAPTLEEVKAYCLERKNNVEAERFIDFYQSKGWLVGKSKMKDWKACVRTWERSNTQPQVKNGYKGYKESWERTYTEEELNARFDNLDDIEI